MYKESAVAKLVVEIMSVCIAKTEEVPTDGWWSSIEIPAVVHKWYVSSK